MSHTNCGRWGECRRMVMLEDVYRTAPLRSTLLCFLPTAVPRKSGLRHGRTAVFRTSRSRKRHRVKTRSVLDARGRPRRLLIFSTFSLWARSAVLRQLGANSSTSRATLPSRPGCSLSPHDPPPTGTVFVAMTHCSSWS